MAAIPSRQDAASHPPAGGAASTRRKGYRAGGPQLYTEAGRKEIWTMNQDKEGFCRQTISLDSRTARLQHEEFESVPLFDATRRFSCIFLSTSSPT
jgi:hypothetical protein